MPSWPDTLPGMQAGLTDKAQPVGFRTENDTGPASQRRRYTAKVRKLSVPFACNNAERVIFDAFFYTDLEGGVLSFDWVDPVTNQTATFRFIVTDPPEWKGVVGSDPMSVDRNETKRWETTLMLEILP